jgi:hypothetical protein
VLRTNSQSGFAVGVEEGNRRFPSGMTTKRARQTLRQQLPGSKIETNFEVHARFFLSISNDSPGDLDGFVRFDVGYLFWLVI